MSAGVSMNLAEPNDGDGDDGHDGYDLKLESSRKLIARPSNRNVTRFREFGRRGSSENFSMHRAQCDQQKNAKLTKNVGDFGKLIVVKGFEKLPKVQ